MIITELVSAVVFAEYNISVLADINSKSVEYYGHKVLFFMTDNKYKVTIPYVNQPEHLKKN
jgi:hypothetical protein